MKIEWRTVLRDALAVLLLGFLGALFGGALGGEANGGLQAPSVIVLMAGGFCVSGCLAKRARFKHLVLVAVAVWLIGKIASAISTGAFSLLPLNDLVGIFVAMLLGGLISLAIVRSPPSAEPPAPPPSA
jgi:hypothetical protein